MMKPFLESLTDSVYSSVNSRSPSNRLRLAIRIVSSDIPSPLLDLVLDSWCFQFRLCRYSDASKLASWGSGFRERLDQYGEGPSNQSANRL